MAKIDLSDVGPKKANVSDLIWKYMRPENLPHIWCPGCGHGIIMRAVAQAMENCHLDRNKTVVVSGIGCSSRAAGYIDTDTLHTTHGRAIAFATGVKLAHPELEVIVLTGDGDCAAIGGNHLIHACRRNIGLTVVCMNNNIYGMTGGQYSPTTPYHEFGTTAPYGNIDRTFDLPKLAEAAGATFTARGDVYNVNQLTKLIEEGIKHKGMSFVEAVGLCPTYYGRKNKKGSAVKMLNWQKENCVTQAQAAKMTPEELQGKIITGKFHEEDFPEYTTQYDEIIARLAK